MPFDPADIVCVIFLCVLQTARVSGYSEKIAEQKDLHVTSCNAMKRLLCVYSILCFQSTALPHVTQWIKLRSVSHNLSDGRML